MTNDARQAAEPPQVSVVVCSRGRPDELFDAIRSILANRHPAFELIVVRQDAGGSGDASDPVVEIDDERLRLIDTATTGLSRARNIGLRASRADVVLMTDDDCTASPTWIDEMVLAFRDADLLFGPVEAAPCDDAAGFVPAGPISADRVVHRVRDYRPGEGIGANLRCRRSAVLELGGFDEHLGAGTDLKSAEEVDVVIRTLLRGGSVATSRSGGVVHHGFRTHEQGRTLIRGYMLGTAAAYTKLVKSGHVSASVPFARAVWVSLVPVTVDALRARQLPPIVGRVRSLLVGAWAGLRRPVDRTTLCFA